MELAIAPQDQDVLLKDKNVITESVLDKYRAAGQVAQTALTYLIKLINDGYHLNEGPKLSIIDLCLLGDSFIQSSLDDSYKSVLEKGIAQPVCIDVNNINGGFAPELDDLNKSFEFLNEGDIVTITLGAHVDGYTANVSHTLVIYPPGELKDGKLVPVGPLLGGKADSVIAAYIANEAIVNLLACSMTPEKLPELLKKYNLGSNGITGTLIRKIVDEIAESFNCKVVPGSRVRRIRRFLAGQAEGVVAEKEYKGVVWSESDQEVSLLEKASTSKELIKIDKSTRGTGVNQISAIPTDEFVVLPSEVYLIDIKMVSISEFNELGLVTIETLDGYSGKNHQNDDILAKPSIFIRDFAIQYTLKLKTSRQTLTKIDKTRSVYPFKLSHLSNNFPIDLTKLHTLGPESLLPEIEYIKKDIKIAKLGLTEIVNNRLAINKNVSIVKFLPFKLILNTANPTGAHGYDAENPTLPGLELPLPRLGVSSLKLKQLLKKNKCLSIPVAREQTTVLLQQDKLLRLTGGKTCKSSWVHSQYQLDESKEIIRGVIDLVKLGQDKRFGLDIRETQPLKLSGLLEDKMEI